MRILPFEIDGWGPPCALTLPFPPLEWGSEKKGEKGIREPSLEDRVRAAETVWLTQITY